MTTKKEKRRITTHSYLDGTLIHSSTKLRNVYVDTSGAEYINYNRRKYFIVNDSFDVKSRTIHSLSLHELIDLFTKVR